MKLKTKMALLSLASGMIAFQLWNCARFWGDLIGDAWITSVVD